MDKLKIYDVFWSSHNAGPSPDSNKRTEIFLAGCRAAMEGEPCFGCFNPTLWSDKNFMAKCTPEEAFETISKNAPNRFITFVGGEPLDQIEPLVKLCGMLKENGFHIIVFTHFEMSEVVQMRNGFELLNSINILIDGRFDMEEKIYNDTMYEDGFRNAIGSGNQVVWDLNVESDIAYGMPARELVGLYVTRYGELKYITKDSNSAEMFVRIKAGNEVVA